MFAIVHHDAQAVYGPFNTKDAAKHAAAPLAGRWEVFRHYSGMPTALGHVREGGR